MAVEDLTQGAEGAGAESGGQELSLRDQLAAALEADVGGDAGSSAVQPQAQGAQQAGGDQAQTQAAGTQGAQPRDPASGQFAKKGEQAQNAQPSEPGKPGAAQSEPPSQATIGPPPSWSAAAKADFPKLPPHIQQEVLKREGEMQAGKAQWQQGAERLNRLDAVLAPRRERFALAGLDDVAAIRTLIGALDGLDKDPVNTLLFLARQSGVGPQHLAQALGQNPQQQQQQVPPWFQPFAQQVQTLAQAQTQQQAQAEQSLRSDIQSQIDAFVADPKNVYFENVRVQMAKLMRQGDATSIADAYEKACWSSPEIRPLMLRSQAEAQAADAQAQARAKAEQARRASGSVIGSPTPGATPAGGSTGNLRGDLQQAWDAATA